MTLLDENLLATLKEILEVSEAMTGITKFTADEMVYTIVVLFAVEWAKRVIALAESGTN